MTEDKFLNEKTWVILNAAQQDKDLYKVQIRSQEFQRRGLTDHNKIYAANRPETPSKQFFTELEENGFITTYEPDIDAAGVERRDFYELTEKGQTHLQKLSTVLDVSKLKKKRTRKVKE